MKPSKYRLEPFDMILTKAEICAKFNICYKTVTNYINGTHPWTAWVIENNDVRIINIQLKKIVKTEEQK